MKHFNVGIVGYGWAAGAHIDAIRQTRLGRVSSIYSSRASELNAAELAEQHGPPIRLYGNLSEMLADPKLDVIDVTTFPSQHKSIAVQAAEAGKHIIVEKPLAMSWEDCQAIRRAVNSAGVQLCVCLELRFSEQFLAVKQLIDNGMLGEIHYGEVDYYHGIGPWYGQYRWNTKRENGGSSLLSAGCHALDALLLCMDGEVESVTSVPTRSKSSTFREYEYPTTSVNLIRFTDGRVGKVTSCIDCLQPYYFHTHLVGSEGSLLDNRLYSKRLGDLNKNAWSELNIPLVDSGNVADHPYQKQFDAFFDALARDVPIPLTGLADASRTFEVLFACERSAADNGRSVPLSEMNIDR
jgi:UDP-N-acetyl-2-amino-2-deoxyglucuronate dehydrogenase